MIRLADIRLDGGTQARAAIDQATVDDYAEAMLDPNTVFPPISVYYDGKDYWLADGFHRVAAWAKIGREEVPADVRQGDRRRAQLHSVAANAAHGLRRSPADKRRAIMMLLDDEEWSQWSDREIARRCAVSPSTVAKCRAEAAGVTVQMDSEPRTYTTKHGTPATMDTAKIGRAKANREDEPEAQPEPPAEQAARPAVAEAVPEPELASAEPNPDLELQPEAEPDPHAAERKALAKLTREGLEDEVIGLRGENAEMRKRIKAQTDMIADLKAEIKQFTSADDAGRKIGELLRKVAQAEGRSREHQANAARLQRQVNAQKAEIEALKKKLEGQEFVL